METQKNTKYDHDLGLRHRSGMTASKFIEEYCKVLRHYAFATQDDSLNEFEKLLNHVLNMLRYHQRRAEMIGLPPDPRDSIWNIEDAQHEVKKARMKLAGSLCAARGTLPSYYDIPDEDETTNENQSLENKKIYASS